MGKVGGDRGAYYVFLVATVIVTPIVFAFTTSHWALFTSSIYVLIGTIVISTGFAFLVNGIFDNYKEIRYDFMIGKLNIPEFLTDFLITAGVSWVILPVIFKAGSCFIFGHLGRVTAP